MSKLINISLRLKLTVLTMVLLFCLSGILTIFFNYNAGNRIQLSAIPLETAVSKLVKIEDNSIRKDLESHEIKPDIVSGVKMSDSVISSENNNLTFTEAKEMISFSISTELKEATNDIEHYSYMILGIIILFGGLFAYLLSGKILKPVEKLALEMENITANNLSSPIDTENSSYEIRKLSNSFNKMLFNLNETFEMQKRFNTNAAHELRTPIAILQTNIEAIECDENTNIDEYIHFCNIAKRTVKRMDSLVSNLLQMTQLENLYLEEEFETESFIQEVINETSILVCQNGIDLSQNLNCQNVSIKGNKVLLHTAIFNLIENAFKYNKEGGQVKIYANIEQGNLKISVSDTGIGIADYEFNHIFQPFYRVDKSRSRASGGAGMGLSLVKNIVERHCGTVSVVSEIGLGSCFVISLPIISMRINDIN